MLCFDYGFFIDIHGKMPLDHGPSGFVASAKVQMQPLETGYGTHWMCPLVLVNGVYMGRGEPVAVAEGSTTEICTTAGTMGIVHDKKGLGCKDSWVLFCGVKNRNGFKYI